MGWEVEVTKPQLVISPETRKKINELLARKNLQQMEARKDATGRSLPPGIDLERSGRLKASLSWDVEGYGFGVPYAEAVNARFNFLGLSDRALEELDDEIAKLLEAEATLIEER